MYNKKIKETDQKEKLWGELGEELEATNWISVYYDLFLVSKSFLGP